MRGYLRRSQWRVNGYVSLPQFMSVIRSPTRLIYERNFFQGAARHRAREVFSYFRDFCDRQMSRKFTMNGNESKLGGKSSRASGQIVKIAERAKPRAHRSADLFSSTPSLLPRTFGILDFRNSTRENEGSNDASRTRESSSTQ